MSSPAADNDDTLRDDSTPDATTVDTTTDTAAAELDRFKENIRPLRQGRNVAALLSAMSLSTTAEEELFHERKRQFATRLKRYTGADPLALWHEHIIWLEQTAFRGANEGGLVDILRKCVQALHPDKLSARRPAYLADRRYVDVWLRLAGYSDEPLHVFEYMLQKQVGVHEPSLYTAWAAQLDAIRQSTRGLAVLERGKASVSTADDKALLEAAHQELESCIARRAVESVMAATEGNGESDILRLDDNDHFDVADRIGLRDFGGRLTAAPVSNKNQSNTNSSEGIFCTSSIVYLTQCKDGFSLTKQLALRQLPISQWPPTDTSSSRHRIRSSEATSCRIPICHCERKMSVLKNAFTVKRCLLSSKVGSPPSQQLPVRRCQRPLPCTRKRTKSTVLAQFTNDRHPLPLINPFATRLAFAYWQSQRRLSISLSNCARWRRRVQRARRPVMSFPNSPGVSTRIRRR